MSSHGDQREDSRGPLGTSHNDEKPEGWCEVICVIPDLKTNRRLSLSSGQFVNKPVTGKFNYKFSTRSFEFDVHCLSKAKKPVKYSFCVKKLPGDIVAEESKARVKDGKVILSLKKVEPGSWARDLSANGIDQSAIDEEDEDQE